MRAMVSSSVCAGMAATTRSRLNAAAECGSMVDFQAGRTPSLPRPARRLKSRDKRRRDDVLGRRCEPHTMLRRTTAPIAADISQDAVEHRIGGRKRGISAPCRCGSRTVRLGLQRGSMPTLRQMRDAWLYIGYGCYVGCQSESWRSRPETTRTRTVLTPTKAHLTPFELLLAHRPIEEFRFDPDPPDEQ